MGSAARWGTKLLFWSHWMTQTHTNRPTSKKHWGETQFLRPPQPVKKGKMGVSLLGGPLKIVAFLAPGKSTNKGY